MKNKKCRLAIFFDDEATKNLLAKAGHRRGYDVIVQDFPKECIVASQPGCPCTKEAQCADIVILGRHFGIYRALEFLDEQIKAGCRLSVKNKLVICSSYDEKEEEKAKALGVKVFYLPFSLKDLDAWLSECEGRL